MVTGFAVAGCTSTPAAPTAPAAANGGSTPAPSTAGQFAVATTGEIRAVELPGDFRTLLPVVEKTGDAALPVFTPTQEAYTLFIKCQGGGDLTVRYNDESDVDTWPCDGVLNRGRVYSTREPQTLVVRAARTATWSAGIVDGSA